MIHPYMVMPWTHYPLIHYLLCYTELRAVLAKQKECPLSRLLAQQTPSIQSMPNPTQMMISSISRTRSFRQAAGLRLPHTDEVVSLRIFSPSQVHLLLGVRSTLTCNTPISMIWPKDVPFRGFITRAPSEELSPKQLFRCRNRR
jgi:hypothetical protein